MSTNKIAKEKKPRIFFLHFWGVDTPKLAKGLRATLDQTGKKP